MNIKHIEGYGDGDLELILGESTDNITLLTKALQENIASQYPGVVEVVWQRQKIAGYGVGPKKMSEQFCYVGIYKKHVNLGFYYGAHLQDPKGLLQGTGKDMRHIKIMKTSDITEDVVQLLTLAIEDIKIRLGIE